MAKIGLQYVVAGKLGASQASGADAKYTEGMYLGPSTTFSVSPNVADASDYGDDHMTESDKSVTGGTVSVEINEFQQDVEAFMLGHKYDEAKKIMTASANDVAPYLGIGAVGVSKVNGVRKYRGKWYYKTVFGDPADENTTKGESISFSHTSLEGTLLTLDNGDWKEEEIFDTLDAAKTWLNGKAGITTT